MFASEVTDLEDVSEVGAVVFIEFAIGISIRHVVSSLSALIVRPVDAQMGSYDVRAKVSVFMEVF